MLEVHTVVVIPVGPNLRYDFLCDTIASISHYTQSSYAIVIVDDSGEGVGSQLVSDFAQIHLIETVGKQGINGGLYFGTSQAFAYALERFSFNVLLRLDTDALIIGANSDLEAAAFFERYPMAGLLGSYRVGSDGAQRDFAPARRILKSELSALRTLLARRSLKNQRFMRDTTRAAVENGYELGEHCLAAATYFSVECVAALSSHKLLGREEFRRSALGDDHLFGLLVYAAGYRLMDFATGDLPIAVKWRGLPFSPQELLQRRKKITHSTRFWQDMNEDEIRSYFRTIRQADSLTSRLT